MTTGLFLFQNDLRLHDNPALKLASKEVDNLICIYCLTLNKTNRLPYFITHPGRYRRQFLLQSLTDLDHQLSQCRQRLLVLLDHPLDIIPALITQYKVTALYRSQHAGYNENQTWRRLKQRYPYLSYTTTASHTLFEQAELPFDINELPATFSQFRRQVEQLPTQKTVSRITRLPPPPRDLAYYDPISALLTNLESRFKGGERAGLKHLQSFFAGRHPSHYKLTRNALDGWNNSTKFSPWLALGCLSARTLLGVLEQYQDQVQRNTSTEWIKFELLWREYFQWYAHCHQAKLFAFKGIGNQSPHTRLYAERFRRWCHGNTPYPIVNACMKQLRHTGYMSNRGRQLVASCLVNELSLDWRYGAAYFEKHLVDYDVASNWGNWQYIAGVGADAKEHRHFNLQKQTERYDPDHEFIRKWKGDQNDGNWDAVDAADWPIDK